jgi:hypothetical protein
MRHWVDRDRAGGSHFVFSALRGTLMGAQTASMIPTNVKEKKG